MRQALGLSAPARPRGGRTKAQSAIGVAAPGKDVAIGDAQRVGRAGGDVADAFQRRLARAAQNQPRPALSTTGVSKFSPP